MALQDMLAPTETELRSFTLKWIFPEASEKWEALSVAGL